MRSCNKMYQNNMAAYTRKQKLLVLDTSTRFRKPRTMWNYPSNVPHCTPTSKRVANGAVPLENEQTPLQNRAVKRVANQVPLEKQ